MLRIRLLLKQNIARLPIYLIDLQIHLINNPQPIRCGLQTIWLRSRALESFLNLRYLNHGIAPFLAKSWQPLVLQVCLTHRKAFAMYYIPKPMQALAPPRIFL